MVSKGIDFGLVVCVICEWVIVWNGVIIVKVQNLVVQICRILCNGFNFVVSGHVDFVVMFEGNMVIEV